MNINKFSGIVKSAGAINRRPNTCGLKINSVQQARMNDSMLTTQKGSASPRSTSSTSSLSGSRFLLTAKQFTVNSPSIAEKAAIPRPGKLQSPFLSADSETQIPRILLPMPATPPKKTATKQMSPTSMTPPQKSPTKKMSPTSMTPPKKTLTKEMSPASTPPEATKTITPQPKDQRAGPKTSIQGSAHLQQEEKSVAGREAHPFNPKPLTGSNTITIKPAKTGIELAKDAKIREIQEAIDNKNRLAKLPEALAGFKIICTPPPINLKSCLQKDKTPDGMPKKKKISFTAESE